MYCPKCSQQQASEQRFCSRCGFPLTGVAALLASDGVLPDLEQERRRRRSPRFDGVRQGVILFMLAVVLLPLVDVIGAPYHEALVFMLMLAGAMRVGYALVFQEGAASQRAKESELSGASAAVTGLSGGRRAAALPAASSIPAAELVNRRKETAEMSEPPSVTENTTRLFDEK
jgi:hypothetical protein